MGTAIVLLILAGVVGLAVRSMVKDKKAGKSLQCGQDCKNFSGHCNLNLRIDNIRISDLQIR